MYVTSLCNDKLTSDIWNIVASLNVETSYLRNFLLGEFDFLEILLDACCRDGLGDYAVSADLSPGDPKMKSN